jgi:WD40 repeat protein
LLKLIKDARRFIMYHKTAIENSPLQAYTSALLFSPARSLIKGLFGHEEPKWITIKPPIRDQWSACLQTLEGHSGAVYSVAFSADSTRLASASGDSTVRIWDTSSGACIETLEVGKILSHISFDATGLYLDTEIGVIAINAPLPLNTTPIATKPQGLQYQGGGLSSDGAWITYGSINVVRLPSEYRPFCSAVSANTVAIGVGSGRVWMCSFNDESS